MNIDSAVAALEQRADDFLVANRLKQLPPLSAESLDPPSSARSGTGRLFIGKPKVPRTPTVKRLLGQLEAKLSSNVKVKSTYVAEDQSQGPTVKPNTSRGKIAPAEVQELLRSVSSTFGEVIELLPSYRQLLVRIQETYDSLVTQVLEELSSTANLRSRMRVMTAQLQGLEQGNHLFPAKSSWAEACKLRRQLAESNIEHQRQLADRNVENQALEDECRKLQEKVSKQTEQVCELQEEIFWNQQSLLQREVAERANKRRLAERSKALAKKRWCDAFTWTKKRVAETSEALSSSSESDEAMSPGPSQLQQKRRGAVPMNFCFFNPAMRPEQRPEQRPEPQLEDSNVENLSTKPLESEPEALQQKAMETKYSVIVGPTTVVSQVEDHPERWGISLKQLHHFWDEIKEDLLDYCKYHKELLRGKTRLHICQNANCAKDHANSNHELLSGLSPKERSRLTPISANMHLVANRYIKPQTAPHGKSYALMKNPRGLKINLFITQAWSDKFKNFVHTLCRALKESDVLWVCSFALPQNSTEDMQELLEKDLRNCAFSAALRHADSHIVVLDEDAVVSTRLWCMYEIHLGSSLQKPLLIWPHHMHHLEQLHHRIEALDMETAKATRRQDEERIKADMRKMPGFEILNRQLRDLLYDRTRFAVDVWRAGKHGGENVMVAFRQKLAEEEKEHRQCQLEKTELSQKLQAALEIGNSEQVGDVCQATVALKMDRYEKECWEGIRKMHLMLEYQPLKANATPVHAMQVICNALVWMHRESEDVNFGITFSNAFTSAFEKELEKKGLLNIREDVIKFIAQIKPPQEFFDVFLPMSCKKTWDAFGKLLAKEKVVEIVSQRSIEEERSIFQDRLVEIEQKISDKSMAVSSQSIGVLLLENHSDVMQMIDVITRIQKQIGLSEEAHRDQLDKIGVANKRRIEDLQAQIQGLKYSQDNASGDTDALMQFLSAETEEEKVLELKKEMSRLKAQRNEFRINLEEMQKQQKGLIRTIENTCSESNAMKEELDKNQAVAEYWQKEAENLKNRFEEQAQKWTSDLKDQTAATKRFKDQSDLYKWECNVLKLKPQAEAKTPAVAMKYLCAALVRAADEQQLGLNWYECFQSLFRKSLQNIPSQKEDIESFICGNGGQEFQIRFLPYCSTPKHPSNKQGDDEEMTENADAPSASQQRTEGRRASAPQLPTR